MDRHRRARVSTLTTFGASRAVRWDRCDYAGDEIIHLTICANRGQPFTNSVLASMICDAVTECCNLRGYRLYGYCLMPDHLHVLLSPNNSGIPLARWLNTFKTFTSNEFTKRGNTPPLWQRSAHDHVCRTGETAESVLKYIADNPVRAGLVKNWRDWKWTKA